jgi:long-chain acyl-CoA synthetase
MDSGRLFDLLDYQKEKYNLEVCLAAKQDGKWIKYSTAEVIRIVNQLSLGLQELGIGKGDKVAIISTNRPEWNFVDLAVQQLGAVTVPMYPTITIEDYKYIFAHSESKIIFVENKDLYQKATKAAEELDISGIYTFDKLDNAPQWKEVYELGSGKDAKSLDPIKASIDPEDLLTIIYTSGTTGRPKGVMLNHRNIMSNVRSVSTRTPIEPGKSRALSFLPLCHIYERTGVYFCIYLGISVYYAENMETIGENLKEVKPHIFNTVPRLLEKVYDKIVAKGYELTGIKKSLFFWALGLGLKYSPNENQGWWYNKQLNLARKLIFSKWKEALGGEIIAINSGASALQPRLARVFWAADIKVCEGYGLTETSPVVSASIPTHHEIRIGCVGTLIEDVEVKIAEDGEILVKGPNVMIGYYKEPEMTAEAIKDGWFYTGDIGEIVEGKYLKITDRKKEMFKTSGGKYVAPQVIENKFKESSVIEQICVVGENQRFPAALIVPSFDGLKEWCSNNNVVYTSDSEIIKDERVIQRIQESVNKYNQYFGSWEQIKKFTLLSQLWGIDTGELTPTLKLKRRVIHQKFKSEIEAFYAS